MSERVHGHRRPRPGLPRGARALALGSATALSASVALTLGAAPAQAAVTLAVSTTGNDGNPCTTGAPCRTVQRAVQQAGLYEQPQAVTIHVGPGTFAENANPAAAVLINGGAVAPLSITIVGAGADRTTVKPTAAGQRVFAIVGNYPVTLRALTITGGVASPGAAGTAGQPGAAGSPGGGIARTGSGNLTLADVVLTKNAAGTGGKGADGTPGTTGSANGTDGGPATAGGDGGMGGGVAFLGTGNLTITGSTISGNSAGWGGAGGTGGAGGAGRNFLTTDGNGGAGGTGGNGGRGGAGGAIAFAGNVLTVTNSTIATNATGRGGSGGAGGAGGRGGGSSPTGHGGNGGDGGNGGNSGPGGGIELLEHAVSASLTHVTIAANAVNTGGSVGPGGTAGGGIPAGAVGDNGDPGLLQTSAGLHRTAGSLTVTAGLLANQPANCGSADTLTASNTVASDDSCFAAAGGLLVDAAAGNLAALAANGAAVPTSAPTTGNPAIGAVPAVACAPTDERGKPRPGLTAPATCTAGAFEPQKPPVAPTVQGVVSAAHGRTKYNWYRDTVTVTFTCTAGSAPLTTPCPAPMVLTKSGANQGGVVTVTNGDGLSSSIRVSINIDRTSPTIRIKGVKKGKSYAKPKRVTCIADDRVSGPYACQVTGTAKLVNHNRSVKVRYTATAADKAGNVTVKKGWYTYTYRG